MSRIVRSRRLIALALAGTAGIAAVPAVAFARNGGDDGAGVPATTDVTTDDSTPGTTDDSTPGSTPVTTDGSTPDSTPGTTPNSTPNSTPGTTDDSTPNSTPNSTPDSTPDSTPGLPIGPFTETYTTVGGSVTVSFDGTRLRVTGIGAAPGYETEIKKNDGDDVEVRFEADDDESRIRVRIDDGSIRAEVEEHS